MNEAQAKELYARLGKVIRFMPKYWLAQCPNPQHPDKHPSCTISKSHPHHFKCRSCGAAGNLNTIAKDYGMEVDTKVEFSFDAYRSVSLPDLSKLRLEGWTGDYRRISEETWQKFGALKWWDTAIHINEDGSQVETLEAIRLLLPIYLKGILIGYVGRRTDQDEFKKYNNFGGANFSELLYPYDWTQPGNPIVLVEGPLDALRCWLNGIPALCLFGTQSWTDRKLALLLQKNPSTLWLCMDNDQAGQDAQTKLYHKLSRFFDTQVITLPQGLDPDALEESLLVQIKDAVWQRHFEKTQVLVNPIGKEVI